jgi:hypothetical protein
MTDQKDYTELTLEALRTEEQKLKRQNLTGNVFIGFLAGVMIYGLVKNGFGLLYTAIPLLIIAVLAKNGQSIQAKWKATGGDCRAGWGLAALSGLSYLTHRAHSTHRRVLSMRRLQNYVTTVPMCFPSAAATSIILFNT